MSVICFAKMPYNKLALAAVVKLTKFKRKYFIITCMMINIATFCNGQTANERIVFFCKTWGFLKYRYTAISLGNINWDSVFVNNVQ